MPLEQHPFPEIVDVDRERPDSRFDLIPSFISSISPVCRPARMLSPCDAAASLIPHAQ